MKKVLIGIAVAAIGIAFVATSANAFDFKKEAKKQSRKAGASTMCNQYNQRIEQQNCAFRPGTTDQLTCDINKVTAELQAAQKGIQETSKRDVDVHILAYGKTNQEARQRANFVKNKLKMTVPWDYYTQYERSPSNNRVQITLKAN